MKFLAQLPDGAGGCCGIRGLDRLISGRPGAGSLKNMRDSRLPFDKLRTGGAGKGERLPPCIPLLAASAIRVCGSDIALLTPQHRTQNTI